MEVFGDEASVSFQVGDAAKQKSTIPLHDIREALEHQLDLVIDAGPCGIEASTVIDLTGDTPLVLRRGSGSLAPFAVEAV